MPITFHLFEHAPDELRALSTNGGDEDFVIVIPASHITDWEVEFRGDETRTHPVFDTWRIDTAVRGASPNGDPDWFVLDNGDAVAITAHA